MPAPVPIPVVDQQGRLTVSCIVDRTILTTSTASTGTLAPVSRLETNDFANTTKVKEIVEQGTDGIVGGVADLGEFKGKMTRQGVSAKLIGLLTGKKQSVTSGNTTTWTYRDFANANLDYVRLLADPAGNVYASMVAMDVVLDSVGFDVKTGGEMMEDYGTMGKQVAFVRGFPIGKTYVIQAADVTAGFVIISSILGAQEVPLPIVAPSAGQPPSSLYGSGRRSFLKVELIPSTNRVINGCSYPAGYPIRIREITNPGSPISGQCVYDPATSKITFGDTIVATDVVRLLFASYGSNSTVTTVGQNTFDTTDEVGIPARTCPITISGYGVPRVQTVKFTMQIGRKHVNGVGEDEITYGTPSVQNTSVDLDCLATDPSIISLLTTGATTGGGDIYSLDYLTRYTLKNPPSIKVDVKSPNANNLILLTLQLDKPVIESVNYSGNAESEQQLKLTGKDLGKGLSIVAVTP